MFSFSIFSEHTCPPFQRDDHPCLVYLQAISLVPSSLGRCTEPARAVSVRCDWKRSLQPGEAPTLLSSLVISPLSSSLPLVPPPSSSIRLPPRRGQERITRILIHRFVAYVTLDQHTARARTHLAVGQLQLQRSHWPELRRAVLC